jgi:hypothetical protein
LADLISQISYDINSFEMKFEAKIKSRSSIVKSGPPSETEILRLNPQRREKILTKTGWDELVEGTLNLEVEEAVVRQLLKRKPIIREPGSEVKYPANYKYIPLLRKAYLYFRGTISNSYNSEDVLFRTAQNPLLNRLEAFAPVKLRERLNLLDEDQVFCKVNETLKT